jgi:hypothetical protein
MLNHRSAAPANAQDVLDPENPHRFAYREPADASRQGQSLLAGQQFSLRVRPIQNTGDKEVRDSLHQSSLVDDGALIAVHAQELEPRCQICGFTVFGPGCC